MRGEITVLTISVGLGTFGRLEILCGWDCVLRNSDPPISTSCRSLSALLHTIVSRYFIQKPVALGNGIEI